ncbi:hypothetical protein BDZ89DRAFT_817724 [Hymenopellis radicata]|nr:hypothetical protein BDZ89DRAFT_817724 [Hymenopellis radicata]
MQPRMSRIPQLLLCPARCVLVFILLGSVSYCFTPVLYSRRPPVCICILILVPLTLRTSIILAAAAVAVGFLATVSPDRFIRLGCVLGSAVWCFASSLVLVVYSSVQFKSSICTPLPR